MNRNYRVGWWLIVITIVLIFVLPLIFADKIIGFKTPAEEYTFALLGELLLLIPILLIVF